MDTVIIHADSNLEALQDQVLINTPLFIVTNRNCLIVPLNKPGCYPISPTSRLIPGSCLTLGAATILDETLTGYAGTDMITISVREM